MSEIREGDRVVWSTGRKHKAPDAEGKVKYLLYGGNARVAMQTVFGTQDVNVPLRKLQKVS